VKRTTMIHQIFDIKPKTASLPTVDRGLIRARHIQAQLKERFAGGSLPSHVEVRRTVSLPSFMSYIVPVSRWIE
jgi:hypothetical protein